MRLPGILSQGLVRPTDATLPGKQQLIFQTVVVGTYRKGSHGPAAVVAHVNTR
jgi:hypothetical protein